MTITTAATPAAPSPSPRGTVIHARGATVKGARGRVFGPIDVTSDAPITIVHGNRGSGRTSLLLSLAGRMKIHAGTISVLGHDARTAASATRHATGIAGFDAIDLLEATARVDEAVRERLTWTSPWYRRVRHLHPDEVATLLTPVFGDVTQPPAHALIRELSEAQDLLLRISLALLERPAMVLVDDLDDVKDPTERAVVADRITALTAGGLFFVVGSADERDINLFSPESRAIVTLDH